MKNLFLILIALVISSVSMAQEQPQRGFNYQAVARDMDGNMLKQQSLSVRVRIYQNEALIWQEEHNVTTNNLGMFNIVIGNPDAGGSGPVESFSEIDWASGIFNLKVDVNNGAGYTDFEPKPLLSVPFALHAPNHSGWDKELETVVTSNPVEIHSEDPQADRPLFEVKNDLGNPVFAVYNDGVMVYIDEEKQNKGVKGGFAVGGYSKTTKGLTQEYLRISPDSTRINFNSSSLKGVKGGFAVGGYTQGKGTADQLMSITPINYLIGLEAGVSLTTGFDNSFLGYQAGYSTTTGSGNIYLGKSSGFSSEYPRENIFIGNESGYMGINSRGNVYVGNQTGRQGTTGDYNSFIGYRSGYNNTANYNSFFGFTSGYLNSTGDYNSFFGYRSGYNNTTGSNNILLGTYAGYGNPTSGSGLTGSNNIFLGNTSGYNNTSGRDNIFIGNAAGYVNTTGVENVIMGLNAGYSSNGDRNVIIGNTAGFNSNVSNSIIIGDEAGYNAKAGWGNVIIGQRSGFYNGTSGVGAARNTFVGRNAGELNDQGNSNTYIGAYAGSDAVNGRYNTFLGDGACENGVPGDGNVYVGYRAGYTNHGQSNVVIGREAGSRQSNYTLPADYDNNVIIGYRAGYNLNTGASNVFIGPYTGYNETGSNKLYIDNSSTSTPLIYGDFSSNNITINGRMGVNGVIPGTTYELDVDGQIRCISILQTSDVRYKTDIQAIEGSLEKVMKLSGTTFFWNKEAYPEFAFDSEKQIGLIAQDVEKVIPELVYFDEQGYGSVDYGKAVSVLIEAIKEQQKQIEALEQRIADLEK